MKVYPRVCGPASEKRQGTKSREEIAGGAAGAMGIEAGRAVRRGLCGAGETGTWRTGVFVATWHETATVCGAD